MEGTSITNKLHHYLDNIDVMKSKLKWKMGTNVMTLLSAVYVIHKKPFNLDKLVRVSEEIKKKVGFFSPFRSYHKYHVAAFLITKYSNPMEKVDYIIELFNQLRLNGLPNNSYTIISALSLMSDEIDAANMQQKAEKIKTIYNGMKSKHYFLTSHSDYPLATLLSSETRDASLIIEDIEYYYHALHERGLKKGNDLQFLSHILMIIESGNRDMLIEKVVDTFHMLKNSEVKIKMKHYSIIGLLAAIDCDKDIITLLEHTVDEMNHKKGLKSLKDINLIVATMFVVMEKVNDNQLLTTNLTTTIESIIQAQNAAMIAAISASTAAATTAATT